MSVAARSRPVYSQNRITTTLPVSNSVAVTIASIRRSSPIDFPNQEYSKKPSQASERFLRYLKTTAARPCLPFAMGALLFNCPNTGRSVQAEGISEEDENTYHAIECAACGQVHLVSPATRRVLRLPGQD
jgi:hypothetical protein